MVSLTEAGVDMFGQSLPSLDDLRKLSDYVNCSESARHKFLAQIAANSENSLAAGIGLILLNKNMEGIETLVQAENCKEKNLYLARAYRLTGQYDLAIDAIDQAGKCQADPMVVALEKAAIYRCAKQFDKAADALTACSNFENVSAEYHYQRGRLHDASGNYDNAVSDYEKAIELDPSHQKAIFHMAYCNDLRGDEDDAIALYKQIALETPIYINALLNLAVLYEDKGLYEQAERCVHIVLESHPNHPRALLYAKDIESSQTMVYDEEKEKQRDKRNKILEIPISDFELSVRSRNCLKKMNINTLGDLLKISEAELLSYKNFGETSLQEIKRILESKTLRLGMALEDKTASYVQQTLNETGANQELLNKSVDELELSVRARRCLTRLNIRTFSELITKTEAELLGCKNFGVTSLNEIKERLSHFGLALRKLE